MRILNCAANGLTEMELGREMNRHKHLPTRTNCKILVLDHVFGYRRSGKQMLRMAEE